LSNKIQFN